MEQFTSTVPRLKLKALCGLNVPTEYDTPEVGGEPAGFKIAIDVAGRVLQSSSR